MSVSKYYLVNFLCLLFLLPWLHPFPSQNPDRWAPTMFFALTSHHVYMDKYCTYTQGGEISLSCLLKLLKSGLRDTPGEARAFQKKNGVRMSPSRSCMDHISNVHHMIRQDKHTYVWDIHIMAYLSMVSHDLRVCCHCVVMVMANTYVWDICTWNTCLSVMWLEGSHSKGVCLRHMHHGAVISVATACDQCFLEKKIDIA